MNPMYSENFNTNEPAVNLHSQHCHTFNFVKFLTGFVKSDLYLGTENVSGWEHEYLSVIQ